MVWSQALFSVFISQPNIAAALHYDLFYMKTWWFRINYEEILLACACICMCASGTGFQSCPF